MIELLKTLVLLIWKTLYIAMLLIASISDKPFNLSSDIDYYADSPLIFSSGPLLRTVLVIQVDGT